MAGKPGKPVPENLAWVALTMRGGGALLVRPESVVCIEGDIGPRIYLDGGHSIETSVDLTAQAIAELLTDG